MTFPKPVLLREPSCWIHNVSNKHQLNHYYICDFMINTTSLNQAFAYTFLVKPQGKHTIHIGIII